LPDIQVQPALSRRQQRAFMSLPLEIYEGDPNWVPPIWRNQRPLVGFGSHPFYERNQGQAFLATRGGQPVGRIVAIPNRAHIERNKEQRGFFGFLECIDDQAVATALFDTARTWLAERDIHQIRGPANPSLNYEAGLLVDGFDSSPTFMMTYNPAYYARLIEAYGFEKVQDMYAYWGHTDMLYGLDEKLSFVVDEATRRFNIKLRQLDRRRFAEDVRTFLDLYNKSLVGTWGFAPMSEGGVDHMAADLKHLIVPELTSLAEVDGQPIGAAFALLDYNPYIKKCGGRLFPFGFLRILFGKKKLKDIRILSANVLPEYQKWGIGLVLLRPLVPECLEWGVKNVEFSWVLESNHLSRKTLERGGTILQKTYRMYDYPPGQ